MLQFSQDSNLYALLFMLFAIAQFSHTHGEGDFVPKSSPSPRGWAHLAISSGPRRLYRPLTPPSTHLPKLKVTTFKICSNAIALIQFR